MSDWELSASLLAGRAFRISLERAMCLWAGSNARSETRESYVETCVYHDGGLELPSLALLLSRQSRQTCPGRAAQGVVCSRRQPWGQSYILHFSSNQIADPRRMTHRKAFSDPCVCRR